MRACCRMCAILTSPEGLANLAAKARAKTGGALPDSFEALITVTGFGQTDLTTEIIAVDPLPFEDDQTTPHRLSPPPR